MSFGFIKIHVDGEGRPFYLLCMKILTAGSMKPNKLKRHLETVHAGCVGKTHEFFHRKLNEFKSKNMHLLKIATVISKPLLAPFRVSYRNAKCIRTSFDWRNYQLLLIWLKQCFVDHLPKNSGKFHGLVTL